MKRAQQQSGNLKRETTIGYQKLTLPDFKICQQITTANGFMSVSMSQIITDRLNGLRADFRELNLGMTNCMSRQRKNIDHCLVQRKVRLLSFKPRLEAGMTPAVILETGDD